MVGCVGVAFVFLSVVFFSFTGGSYLGKLNVFKLKFKVLL
jgi:hypothetical protein